MTDKIETNTNENYTAIASQVGRLVMRIRSITGIDDKDVDDAQLLEMTKGTYIRAVTNFGLACEDFGFCVKKEIEKTRNKMNKYIDNHLKRILRT